MLEVPIVKYYILTNVTKSAILVLEAEKHALLKYSSYDKGPVPFGDFVASGAGPGT